MMFDLNAVWVIYKYDHFNS